MQKCKSHVIHNNQYITLLTLSECHCTQYKENVFRPISLSSLICGLPGSNILLFPYAFPRETAVKDCHRCPLKIRKFRTQKSN